ncbi:MAG TPA: RidA family protein [Pirellulales bacterium]|jgi:enamine deaminase RidA (YjgF/YER057c/UK114 family)
MGEVETKLKAMGFTLPPIRKFPSPNRRGCVRVGNVLFLSGHGPHHPGFPHREAGKLGADMTIDEGKITAQAAALAMLATVKNEVGDLDNVVRVIRLFGMVNSTPDFPSMPAVIDGASDLFFELFGPDAGCHARTAVGMVNLPRGQAVEINGEFEVRN